jgi:phosphonate degradation associated HDIG domain protein
MSTNHTSIIDLIADLFDRRGAEAYAGEALTVAEHMLQAAALAQAEGAGDTLVAAALLHDIGHFVSEFGEYSPEDTEDKHHDHSGANLLAGHFPREVTECVRLHVAAKRYLCATDEAYANTLSAASKHSLQLQGGPMRAAETRAFRRLPFSQDAVRLRRWDDSAKIAGLQTAKFESFKPLLQRVVGQHQLAMSASRAGA